MSVPRAWLVWAACAVVAVATLVLVVIGVGDSTPGDSFVVGGWGGFSFVVASLAFATVGALVTARVPGNAIGAIFCLTGALLGLGDLLFQYADQALYGSLSLPGGEVAAWLQNLVAPPGFGLLGVALLLFPDGRLPSRRWRFALRLALTGIALIVLGYALRPGGLDAPFDSVSNPVGLPGTFGLMDAIAGFGWLFMGASVAFAAAALVVRLRRSSGYERQQLKWIALAAALTGVLIATVVISFFAGIEIENVRKVLLGVGFTAFPLAAGLAILRYRLYDIDVVINRALVYAVLTLTLAVAYLGVVLVLQLALRPLTSDSNLAIAGSTLAVAALFRPARQRIQEAVDRRFFRRRYDAARTLEGFAARLRQEVELDSLSAELRSVVRETVQPAHVSLWLREAER